MASFLLQWSGAWLLARIAALASRRRRWRARWERAARALAPVALAGVLSAPAVPLYHGAFRWPTAAESLVLLTGIPAAAGFASLWAAARQEARGRRRSAASLAWLGGILAMIGGVASAAAWVNAGHAGLRSSGALLGLGVAALLSGLARKPRPIGIWAGAGYVALSLATAWSNGGW